MQDFLRNQLERFAQRLQELDFLLSREDIMGDMKQYRAISAMSGSSSISRAAAISAEVCWWRA